MDKFIVTGDIVQRIPTSLMWEETVDCAAIANLVHANMLGLRGQPVDGLSLLADGESGGVIANLTNHLGCYEHAIGDPLELAGCRFGDVRATAWALQMMYISVMMRRPSREVPASDTRWGFPAEPSCEMAGRGNTLVLVAVCGLGDAGNVAAASSIAQFISGRINDAQDRGVPVVRRGQMHADHNRRHGDLVVTRQANRW